LRIGAFNPYHPCWHFVVFATVVLLRPRLWAGSASQGRLGGLKDARGGSCAVSIMYLSVFKKPLFIFAVVLLFMPFALPAFNSPKNQRQNFWWAQKFCCERLKLNRKNIDKKCM
jgi:hypothetical protein